MTAMTERDRANLEDLLTTFEQAPEDTPIFAPLVKKLVTLVRAYIKQNDYFVEQFSAEQGMAGKPPADHVVVQYEDDRAGGECTRCGETLLLQLPMPITLWSKLVDVFVDYHSKCKPKS